MRHHGMAPATKSHSSHTAAIYITGLNEVKPTQHQRLLMEDLVYVVIIVQLTNVFFKAQNETSMKQWWVYAASQ